MLTVLLVVGLLIVVGGGAFLLTSGGDDEESGQGDTTTTSAGDEDQDGSSSGSDSQEDGNASSSGGGSAEQAEAVVRAYLDVVHEGDCETMTSLVTENMLAGMTREMAVDDCESRAAEEPEGLGIFASLEVRTVSEEDGVATVITDAELDGQPPLIVTFTLVPGGDSWLIDNIS
jgi:hypothetical protein